MNRKSINKVEYNDNRDIREEMIHVESEPPSEEGGDDDENFVNEPRHVSKNRQRIIGNKSTEISPRVNHLTMTKSELPPEAKRVLELITSSKDLVHYVKLVNLNQAPEDKNCSRLVQCTTVRWLSICNCLESVLEGYMPLHQIFDERKLDQKRLEIINAFLLERLAQFLKPWKHVSTRLQSSKIPSIHVVIPAIESLKTSLQWMSNDTKLTYERDIVFFRERGIILLEVMIDYHPIHVMALFLNPKTRKMKQCTIGQRNSCLEYIKEEMIMFDALDNDAQSDDDNLTSIKQIVPKYDYTLRIMEYYYEEENEESDLPTTSAAMHQLEIDNYLKFGMDVPKQSGESTNSIADEQEHNPLHFWKRNCSSYPRLARIAKRVFAVPATSAAVE